MHTEIRTFVALKIHPEVEVLNQLNSFKLAFKNDSIKWTDEANFHLTLRFVGNTTREQLYKLVDGFEVLSEQFKPFQIELKGAGYFQRKGKPQVLFLKIPESEALRNLAAAIEKEVVAAGFYEELKPFRPHLTLGRIKHLESRVRFYSFVDELNETKYQDSLVSEFTLYQSILKPEGPVYKAIKTFKLK